MARRSQAIQAEARLARGADAETLRRRALHDARGSIVRVGVSYFGDGRVVPWFIRRSVAGRTDQLDLVVAGQVWRTGGPRRIAHWLRLPATAVK